MKKMKKTAKTLLMVTLAGTLTGCSFIENPFGTSKPKKEKVVQKVEATPEAKEVEVVKPTELAKPEGTLNKNDVSKDNTKVVDNTKREITVTPTVQPTVYYQTTTQPEVVHYAQPTIVYGTSTTTAQKPISKPTVVVKKDRTAPVINASDMIIDYAKDAVFSNITATDETDGVVLVTFVGDYNNRKAGVYPMTAIAKDKAGNTSKVSFNIIVNAHPRQEELDAANAKVDELINKVALSNSALKEAENTLKALEEELSNKKSALNTATNDLNSSKEELASLQEQVDLAKEILSKAEEAYNDAIEKAMELDGYQDAKELLDAKTDALVLAIEKENEASESLEKAQIAHEVALLTKEGAARNVEQKEAAKEETEKAVEEAQKALDQARKEADSAKTNKEAAQKALSTAHANYNKAVQEKQEAQSALEEAKKLEEGYEVRLAEAQKALQEAESKVAEAQAVIDQGSYGYFVYKNNEGAQAVIDLVLAYQDAEDTTMTEDMRTNLGAKGDATSLENMERAIRMIPKGNELRENDPLFPGNDPEMLVTDTMMALGQVRANASNGYYGHWQYPKQQDYHIGENLAWGYEDPYVGWYTEEKEVYDWLKAKGYPTSQSLLTPAQITECAKALNIPESFVQTGHYAGLLNGGYKYTGFGINGGKYGTMTQEFAYTNEQKGITDTAYTVDEYLADFLAYKNKVEKDLMDAKEAKEAVQTLIDELNENKGLTDEEKAIVEQALLALSTAEENERLAEEKVESATNVLNTADADLSKKNNVVISKEEELGSAQSDDQSAANELSEAQKIDSEAAKEVETTTNSVNQAEATLKEAKEAVETATTELNEAQEVINTMNEAVAEAQKTVDAAKDRVNEAETNYSVVETEVSNKELVVNQTTLEVEMKEKDVEEQKETVKDKKQKVDEATDEYDQAVEDRDEIEQDINK